MLEKRRWLYGVGRLCKRSRIFYLGWGLAYGSGGGGGSLGCSAGGGGFGFLGKARESRRFVQYLRIQYSFRNAAAVAFVDVATESVIVEAYAKCGLLL